MKIAIRIAVTLIILTCDSSYALVNNTNPERRTVDINHVEQLAKAGNSNAQLYLVKYYLENPIESQKNIKTGLFWLEKVGESKPPKFQEFVGEVFHYGRYADRDFKKALYWYKKAANAGLASAMDYVGVFYSGGLGGLNQSCSDAIKWYKKAFSGGFTQSEGNLVWVLATCPDSRYRDGVQALQLALKIIEQKKIREAVDLDNLAAAYAETEQFSLAVKIQQEALSKVDKAKEKARYKKLSQRLKLYKQNKKWRGSSNMSPEDYNQ